MRKLARVLTIITMAVLGVMAVVVAGAGLRVSAVESSAQPAAEQRAAFDTALVALQSGDMGSDQFRRIADRDPAGYEMITYTVSVKNTGLLGADWVRLKLSPGARDVALMAAPVDIGSFGSATVTATLLTEAGGDALRDVWVEYYILGGRMSAAPVSANG